MVAPVTAVTNSTKGALDRMVGRCVSYEPASPAVIGGGDVKIPNAGEVHALVVGHLSIVRRTEEGHGCASGVTSRPSRKDRVVNSCERADIDTRGEVLTFIVRHGDVE